MVQIKYFKHSLLALFLLLSMSATGKVVFRFAAGTISSGLIKTKMEASMSALLSEIDRAGRAGGSLNLSSINMETAAKARLEALWEDAHFICNKQTIISKCLNDFQGYQVRAIPITMKPLDNTYDQSLNREITVSLNKRGIITGVRLAWELHEDVSSILNRQGGVADIRQRLEVLKWVEDFRCYYNEKDINSLKKVFSDDALIITGSVITQRKIVGDHGPRLEQNVRYNIQSKEQYINNMSKYFLRNKHIDVEFDHIAVVRHPAKANIYGVTLHQVWKADHYSDDGWLFLLWDFNDPDHPQIQVRTWQPEQAVTQDGVFTLDDFFIP